jgi:hypothetical protein
MIGGTVEEDLCEFASEEEEAMQGGIMESVTTLN